MLADTHATTEALAWTERIDSDAPRGCVLPVLVRLLQQIAERERRQAASAKGGRP